MKDHLLLRNGSRILQISPLAVKLLRGGSLKNPSKAAFNISLIHMAIMGPTLHITSLPWMQKAPDFHLALPRLDH